MSLLGIKVMSERCEMKGGVLSKIEDYLKRDIEGIPDIINLSEKDKYISDKNNVGLNKAKRLKNKDIKYIAV